MPRPKTRSDDEILDATSRVLLRLGPHKATLAAIAREVRLSPATLVQRFGSKQALVAAFSKRAAERAGSELLSEEEPSLASLREALVGLAASLGTRAQLANSMELLLQDVRDEKLRASARRHAERTEARITEHLEGAARSGEIAMRDVPELARVVHAAYNGAIIQWALRGRGAVGEWVGDTIDAVFAFARTRQDTTRSDRP